MRVAVLYLLVVLGILVPKLYGNPVLYLSFTHGVLDGPNADIYINDILVWPNVPSGSVTSYAIVEATNVTTRNGDEAVAVVQPVVAGTKALYGSRMTFFAAYDEIESNFMVLSGTFTTDEAPVQMKGFNNYEVPLAKSHNSAIRFFFCGPSGDTSIRVSLYRIGDDAFEKFADQIVDSLGNAEYSVIGSGEYLINVRDLSNYYTFYAGVLRLNGSSSYTFTILGNASASEHATPLMVVFQEDVLPAIPSPTTAPILGTPTSTPTPTPTPTPSTEMRLEFFVGIIVCAGFIVAGAIGYGAGIRRSSKTEETETGQTPPIKIHVAYAPVPVTPFLTSS